MDGKVTSFISYDDWGAPTMKPILRLGQRELDLVTEYTGHMFDPLLGVYYARARMYDAANSRWFSMDLIKGSIAYPQSMNLYIYVLNNPLKYTDPFGLSGERVITGDASCGSYIMGAPAEPDFSFWCLEEYVYDPNAIATEADKKSWNEYGALLLKAQLYNSQPKIVRKAMTWIVGLFNEEDAEMARKRIDSDLSDALELYAHYRSAKGTTKNINLEKALNSSKAT